MRMDRYEEDEMDISKKSRTNKNQELYTDVYLNNSYVDISEIEEVVEKNEVQIVEDKKTEKTEYISYTYKEKNYNINSVIEEAILKNEDSLKRSIEHTTEIEGIIRSIKEAEKEREENEDRDLLNFLMPDSDTTTIVGSLEKPIADTKILDTSIIHKDEMSNEILEEFEKDDKELTKEIEKENIDTDNKEIEKEREDLEIDDNFKEDFKFNKKKLFIIIGIILLIGIIFGVLVFTKVIKF